MRRKQPDNWIRLECGNFGCAQHDGITPAQLNALKAIGWTGVRQVRSWSESVKTYDDPADEPPGYSVFDWETHVGLCPACSAKDREPARA